MSTWAPNEHYRYVLKNGMSGWDVWAIQIALNTSGATLVQDGAFGPKTEAAAKALQKRLSVTADGIVGPQTQSTLCAHESAAEGKGRVPAGLLKGICFGESGGIIPATSPLYSNGSRDYGPFQDNRTKPSQEVLEDTFNPGLEAARVGAGIAAAHQAFYGLIGVKTQEQAWSLAVLNYNWPAAAKQIAAGKGETWVYEEAGTGAQRRLADPAPWVEQYGVPGVSTGWDWCRFYITSKVTYVTSWTVS